MSGSGVNKADMKIIGRDILLVKDYDPERGAMILSVPPDVKPNRVSVDAIEHWMIYREHPSVGAIVHVHAWMDDIPSTEINYPCGTYELAHSVAAEGAGGAGSVPGGGRLAQPRAYHYRPQPPGHL